MKQAGCEMWIKKAVWIITVVGLCNIGCEKSDRSFSVLSDQASFSQAPGYEVVPQKIDVLWVIDNSGSMATSQSALTSNFSRFISRFQSLNYDFHMGVTTSEAYLARFGYGTDYSTLSDGVSSHSGIRVMDKNTANLTDVFMINATQGVDGSGDERAFSSFEEVLNSSANASFRRSDAFLAIIIVSDEDDFSANSIDYLANNYADPRLVATSYYKNYLDTLVGAGKYSVNAIAILSDACKNSLTDGFSGRRVGQRYIELADLTGGVKASLCDNFGDSLQLISDTIINQKLAVSFKLNREPQIPTLAVKVNGVTILEDPTNGWTYDSANLILTFHGTSVPPAGASISITYDPLAPKN